MAHQVPWPRILAEGFAIVVSILLAFALQAWWEGTQERAEEISTLRALLIELEANRATIDNSVQQHDDRAKAAQHLLNVSFGVAERPENPEDLAELFREGAATPLLTNYSGGDLTALLASGEIGIIRNPDVRRRVAALPSLLEHARENEEQFATNHHQSLAPFVFSHVPALTLSFPSAPQPPSEGVEAVALQITALLGDDQFESIVGNALIWHLPARNGLQRVSEALDTLIQLIEAELGSTQ